MVYLLIIIGGLLGLIAFLWILKNPVRGLYLIALFLPIQINPMIILAPIATFASVPGYFLTPVEFIFLATLIGWLIQAINKKRGVVFVHKDVYIILGLFLTTLLISCFVTITFRQNFFQFITYLYLVAFFFLITQLITGKTIFQKTIKIWLIAYVGVVLFGLVQIVAFKFGIRHYLFWSLPPDKITSTFLTPNILISYLISLLPLILLLLIKTKNLIKYCLCFGFILLTSLVLVSTGARTAVLLLALTMIMFFLWQIKYLKTWVSYFLLVLIIILSINFISSWQLPHAWVINRALSVFTGQLISVPDYLTPYLVKPSGNVLPTSSSIQDPIRYSFILGWLKTIKESPLIGIGVGNFPLRFPEYAPEWGTQTELHNTYLGIWAETGILGFIALMMFLSLILKKSLNVLKIKDKYWYNLGGCLTIGFISVLIYNLLQFGLRQRHFWFLIAIIVSLNYVIRQRTNTDKHRYEHR